MIDALVHVVEQLSGAILHLLAAAGGVVLLVVLVATWRRARRTQLVLDGVVNATGDTHLDGLLTGVAHLLRQHVDGEIVVVARRRDWLLPRLTGEAPDAIPDTDPGGRAAGTAVGAGVGRWPSPSACRTVSTAGSATC